ncbi:hypothetical protein [Streptomyces sp. NPDC052496]|uniref:hypothetical protein n=1 Tax=Streptomyces sp. NPDC052496 TaxID=3154951 RepID=UPI00341993E6
MEVHSGGPLRRGERGIPVHVVDDVRRGRRLVVGVVAGAHGGRCACRRGAVPHADVPFKEYVDQWVHLAKHDGTYTKYEDAWVGRRGAVLA